MAWTLPDVWRCIPRAEQQACLLFAAAANAGELWVPQNVIDVIFEVAYPGWSDLRIETYRTMYQLSADTITVEDVEIDIYYVNQQWMFDVGACALAGGCGSFEPRCPQMAWPDIRE